MFLPIKQPIMNPIAHGIRAWSSAEVFRDNEGGGYFDPANTANYWQSPAALVQSDETGEAMGLAVNEVNDGRGPVNQILNMAAGAVSGTPGTAPTQVSATSTVNSITRTITQLDNGKFRVQYAGTPSATSALTIRYPSSLTQVAAAPLEVWTGQAKVQMVAGTATNIGTCYLAVIGLDGSQVQTNATTDLFTLDGTEQQLEATNTMAASTASCIIQIVFNYTSGQAINFTVDIYDAQLEKSSAATAVQYNKFSLGGPGFHLQQATNPAKATRGEFPFGGITNNVPSSLAASSTTAVLSTSTVTSFDGVNDAVEYLATAVATPHRVNRTLTAGLAATIPRLFGAIVKVPTGSDVISVFFRARAADTSGFIVLFSASPTSIAFDSVGASFGANPPAAPDPSNCFVEDLGGGFHYIGVYSPTSTSAATTHSQIDIGFSTNSSTETAAGTANTKIIVTGWSREATTTRGPYQKVTSAYQITQTGVPSVLAPYMDGGDYWTSGVTSFGTASLFCDAGQAWTVFGVFSAFSTGGNTLVSKAGGTAASRTFQAYCVNAATSFRTILRGTETDVAFANALDGLTHFYVVRWDGTAAKVFIDGAWYALSVGTAAEETSQNILVGARTESSPGSNWIGFLPPPGLIDRAMSDAEIEQEYQYARAKYGVA